MVAVFCAVVRATLVNTETLLPRRAQGSVPASLRPQQFLHLSGHAVYVFV